jgi:hypothetical protein
MKRLLIVLLIVAAPAAWAEATQCTLGGLTRKVEVVYSSPPAQVPCEVIYSKPNEGETRTSLWNAQIEPGYCEARAQSFVEKLEGLGWSCSGAPAGDAPAAATSANP